MLVKKWIDLSAPLTLEQKAELAALKNIKDEDIVIDEDCPELTEKRLKNIRRIPNKRKVAM